MVQRGGRLRFALLDIFKEEIPLQPNQSLLKWHSPPREEIFWPEYQGHVTHAMSLIPQGGDFRSPNVLLCRKATKGRAPYLGQKISSLGGECHLMSG